MLTAVRWRAAFRWWEFVASLLVIGTTMAVVLRLVAREANPLGLDPTPTALTLTMGLVSALAIPFTFVAGLAFAQLALLLAHRASEVVGARVRRTWPVAVLVAAVAVVDLVLVVQRLRAPTATGASRWAESGSGVLVLAVALMAGRLVLRGAAEGRVEGSTARSPGWRCRSGCWSRSPRCRRSSRPGCTPRSCAGPAPTHLHLDDLRDFLGDADVTTWSRVAAGLGLVAWAVWQRERQPLPAVLAVTIGIVVLAAETDLPWTPDSVNDAALVAATGGLVALGALRRLDRRRLLALGVALGLGLAFSARSTFDAPFVALFGLGATAAVFLGVVWATLTDADAANGDSPRCPRPARVLLFLANALLAMTTLAFLGREQPRAQHRRQPVRRPRRRLPRHRAAAGRLRRAGLGGRHSPGDPAMFTSQLTPNLSLTWPNSSPHGAFSSGTSTVPPSASLSK